ncbi:hypothetical protein D3C86_1881380 [compost metagenome]
MYINLIKPIVQIAALPRIQRLPDCLRYKAQRQTHRCHFHKPLIVVAHLAPVFFMLRVRPVDQPPLINLRQLRLFSAACQIRNQSPQYTGKSLHIGDFFRMSGAGPPDFKTGPSGAVPLFKRIRQLPERCQHIFLCL